eukprot:Plantae.Rhodophyta-Purpureofilum_apyrenoidigerum.ctg426.p1 GENE.Plantae.Rhodophyta-Purpureofilum_apyrenoidigerum.ctg426~~Plantae.Rhodophyta-Purpureofilum_apyrenoidigerum.ctg426.p1  ORF type:complete len:245 (+),score=52.45 Plantae.Rhodophyta-Purpureofilum_apyrenoidigerum.ctg426:300-1034(+)
MEQLDEKMESVTPPVKEKSWLREPSLAMMSPYMGSEVNFPPTSTALRSGEVAMMPAAFPSKGGQTSTAYEMLLEQEKLNQHLQQELAKVRVEVEQLRERLAEFESERQQRDPPRVQTRYWTQQEHEKFIDALKLFGARDVRNIASFVGTRNPTQVRTHAQKYFLKMQREGKSMEMSTNHRRCMSDSDLTKVEKRQSKEIREDYGEHSEVGLPVIQASPLSNPTSGIDLLSVAAEAVKNEAERNQ